MSYIRSSPRKRGPRAIWYWIRNSWIPACAGSGRGRRRGQHVPLIPARQRRFTRCWPYCVRKSARADCDGGPWATINEDKLVLLDSRLRGNERSEEHKCPISARPRESGDPGRYGIEIATAGSPCALGWPTSGKRAVGVRERAASGVARSEAST